LFDETGALVDWTLDVGDSRRFKDKYGVYSGTDVPVETLPAIFDQSRP
jgi:hypothetical protein